MTLLHISHAAKGNCTIATGETFFGSCGAGKVCIFECDDVGRVIREPEKMICMYVYQHYDARSKRRSGKLF